MNLTPAHLRERFLSEVAKNKHLLSVGDGIYGFGYDHRIAEVTETYIQVIDQETGEEDYLEFESMQLGWSIRLSAKNAASMVFRLPEGGWQDYNEAIAERL
jgi:hypothetical protein